MRTLLNRLVFRQIHGNTIVFNDSREDPRIDRIALNLAADDSMLVITSAGCNVLDYALSGVKQIYAVDINPLATVFHPAAVEFFPVANVCSPAAKEARGRLLMDMVTSVAVV